MYIIRKITEKNELRDKCPTLQKQNTGQYKSEVKTIPFGSKGKTITIENLTPVLSSKEREKRKKEIEKGLFNVFRKYI